MAKRKAKSSAKRKKSDPSKGKNGAYTRATYGGIKTRAGEGSKDW